MSKKILIAILILSLVGALGCSSIQKTTTKSTTSIKTIREAGIGNEWTIKQMEITAVNEVSIVLKLDTGDEVDGYFYLEKGNDIDFSIYGKSLIYESEATDTKNQYITSDRFSFTASKAQGIAYTLTFSSGTSSEQESTTIFLELIYPASGTIWVPAESK
jgi:hypothetical protein